ncbi:hypothetical protein Pelo_11023 [Pelomyxa schiedti]|nr:hypothetical protein Pelo_11023 [Pelomyxa schiedti]
MATRRGSKRGGVGDESLLSFVTPFGTKVNKTAFGLLPVDTPQPTPTTPNPIQNQPGTTATASAINSTITTPCSTPPPPTTTPAPIACSTSVVVSSSISSSACCSSSSVLGLSSILSPKHTVRSIKEFSKQQLKFCKLYQAVIRSALTAISRTTGVSITAPPPRETTKGRGASKRAAAAAAAAAAAPTMLVTTHVTSPTGAVVMPLLTSMPTTSSVLFTSTSSAATATATTTATTTPELMGASSQVMSSSVMASNPSICEVVVGLLKREAIVVENTLEKLYHSKREPFTATEQMKNEALTRFMNEFQSAPSEAIVATLKICRTLQSCFESETAREDAFVTHFATPSAANVDLILPICRMIALHLQVTQAKQDTQSVFQMWTSMTGKAYLCDPSLIIEAQPRLTPFEAERQQIYCLCLASILADQFNGNMYGLLGTYPHRAMQREMEASNTPCAIRGQWVYQIDRPTYVGHNIACFAVRKDGSIILHAFNHNKIFESTTEHAEERLVDTLFRHPHNMSVTLDSASASWKQSFLREVTVYTSLEPCHQCAGKLVMAGIKAVIFMLQDPRIQGTGTLMSEREHRTSSLKAQDEMWTQMDQAYNAFSSTWNSTTDFFFRGVRPGGATQLVTEHQIPEFLCTDTAKLFYDRAAAVFATMTLHYPQYTPESEPGAAILTNQQVLDSARSYLSFVHHHGGRNTYVR